MSLRSTLTSHGSGLDERSAGALERSAAFDDDGTETPPRSSLVWLLPWVLASIGFLMTLALLR